MATDLAPETCRCRAATDITIAYTDAGGTRQVVQVACDRFALVTAGADATKGTVVAGACRECTTDLILLLLSALSHHATA